VCTYVPIVYVYGARAPLMIIVRFLKKKMMAIIITIIIIYFIHFIRVHKRLHLYFILVFLSPIWLRPHVKTWFRCGLSTRRWFSYTIIIILSHRDLIQPKCVIKIREKNTTKTYISCSVRAFVSTPYKTQIYMYVLRTYIYNNILYSVWRKRARLVSHAFPLATRVVCSGYTENTKKSYEEHVVFIEPFIFFPARSTAIVNVSSLWLKTYINNCYCNSYIFIYIYKYMRIQ